MKVAFGKKTITPLNFLGMSLAGYTRKKPCLGKLDDIHVHGILIEENQDYLLMLSFDTLKLPLAIVEYMKNKIISVFPSIKSEKILIHATHTHASFDLTGEFHWPGGAFNLLRGIMFGSNRNDLYIVWLANRVIQLFEKLSKQLEPCRIAWKKKQWNPDIVINRRHPTRQSKPELGVIVFKYVSKDEIIGLLTNYSCHPTTLSYKNFKLSADFPGKYVERIEQITDKKTQAIYFNGPSGDLNPITTSGIDYKALEEEKSLIYDQLGTYEDTKKIGYIIAEEALKLARSIDDEEFSDSIKINAEMHEFWIPMKDAKYFNKIWFSNKLYYCIKKLFLLKIARLQLLNANFPFFSLNKKGRKIKCKTIVQRFQISTDAKNTSNKIDLITVPGELFEDLGNKILEESSLGRENTFIFQNSQDWIAYLFTIKEYINFGGYEPFPTFSPFSGEIVLNEVLKFFQE
ncbi:MAG: hypothetical protein KGD66_03310 [Candidatus Lokiarchaeota archaeon]|nr:hypothetical protein [Candidatus Lokiarchaeota archaeon]